MLDSDYSAKTFLSEQSQHPLLVVVTRVRSNRVFYQSPETSSQPAKGHPTSLYFDTDTSNQSRRHEHLETDVVDYDRSTSK